MKLVKRKALSFVLAVALALGLVGVMPGMAAEVKAEGEYTLAQLKEFLGSYEWESYNGDVIKAAAGSEDFISIKKNGGSFTEIPFDSFETESSSENVVVRAKDGNGYIRFYIMDGHLYNLYFVAGNGDSPLDEMTTGPYEKREECTFTPSSLRSMLVAGQYTSYLGNKIERGTDNDFIIFTSKDNSKVSVPLNGVKVLSQSGVSSAHVVLYEMNDNPPTISGAVHLSFYISNGNVSKISWNGGSSLSNINIVRGEYFVSPGTRIISLKEIRDAFLKPVYSIRGDVIKAATGDDFITVCKKDGSGEQSFPMNSFFVSDFNEYGNNRFLVRVDYASGSSDAGIGLFINVENGSVIRVTYSWGDVLGIEHSLYLPNSKNTLNDILDKFPEAPLYNYSGDKIEKGSGDIFFVVTNKDGERYEVNKSDLQVTDNPHMIEDSWVGVYCYNHDDNINDIGYFEFSNGRNGLLEIPYIGAYSGSQNPFGLQEGPFRTDIKPNTDYPQPELGLNQGAIYFIQRNGYKQICASYSEFIENITKCGFEPYRVDSNYFYIYTRGNKSLYELHNPYENPWVYYYTFSTEEYGILKSLGWEGGDYPRINVNTTFDNILKKINPKITYDKVGPTVTLYLLHDPKTGGNIITGDQIHYNFLMGDGWKPIKYGDNDTGIIKVGEGALRLLVLYNTVTGEHYYTQSNAIASSILIMGTGWVAYDSYEGVAEIPAEILALVNPKINLGNVDHTPTTPTTPTNPTTTPPATTTTTPSRDVTIPVSGDTESKVDIKVSGDTAVIGDITPETISAAISDLADTYVSLDLSNQRGVTAATLPKTTLENIANSEDSVGLEIRFAGGNIKLDTAALSELTDKADGDEITISIKTVATTDLNKAQSDALANAKVEIVVQPEIKVGNEPISYEKNDNSKGIMTLFLPYNLQPGQKGEFLHVYYVDDNGKLTRHKTDVGNGGVSFTTTHNSYYVVVYDESYSNEDFLNIFRAYNPETGDHLFTNNRNEYNLVIKDGWDAEGIAFDVNKNGGKAVHRVYNPFTGEHFYTASVREKDKCVNDGWMYEGKTFASVGGTKVYRLYNPNSRAGAHVFTTDEREYAIQSRNGLIGEGVVFMVY